MKQFLKHRPVYLLLIGIVITFVFSLAQAADKKAKPKAQETQQIKQPFIPCHPPQADYSQDGKLFVNANQDVPMLVLLETGTDQKNTQIKLPKKAYDVIFIEDTRAVVSYGPWGELAIVDLKQSIVNKPFKVGESAEAMCKTSDGKILVIDSEKNRIIVTDPKTQKIIKTYPIKGKPAQMRWLVPNLKIEIADAEGKAIGTFKLTQQGDTKGK